ncbi:hypothetical protein TREMEDRAFT_63418 [Tremella mesenterica DSM 1558]|uniref:uncharacterized protein n=1 Tax=Tremella mesenterica (strain ATCC 24925 / CBS 8224 / DSM 1558 / NBRC 9311 / NRRL Y-6157 / RJB 2259-6 / UBC 559-6) TaxID=578456 RepID=UPI0003F49404|nr:uncharacterized protein TREMEDRAFT_63418 [Tremella mesenterica DSM 1558]EIW68245.1 hypothetical protein TREMEDRAFT_63418 [Tremella mesenterica DSM 1558]
MAPTCAELEARLEEVLAHQETIQQENNTLRERIAALTILPQGEVPENNNTQNTNTIHEFSHVGKPESFKGLQDTAIRIDTRWFERQVEKGWVELDGGLVEI